MYINIHMYVRIYIYMYMYVPQASLNFEAFPNESSQS